MPRVKNEVHKSQQELTSKAKRCYKCQGFEHIAFEFPNRKVVSLIEEFEAKEEYVEEVVVKFNHVQEDKVKSSPLSKSELDVEK